MTESETLFQSYCAERGYTVTPIPVVPNSGRFPDYNVQTPNGFAICEVKELTPNEQDKEVEANLMNYGESDYSCAIGKRARASLVEASGQLSRYRVDPRPCMAVIFDTTAGDYLSPADLDAAMFGKPVVLFRDAHLNPKDRRSNFTHGGDRKLTEERRLYVGAVGVLLPARRKSPVRLDIYHNPFTTKPVWPAYFPHPSDRHFIKDGHPDEAGHDWYEYVGPRTADLPRVK